MPALDGPALGARLLDLQERWIASGFSLTRKDLLTDPDLRGDNASQMPKGGARFVRSLRMDHGITIRLA